MIRPTRACARRASARALATAMVAMAAWAPARASAALPEPPVTLAQSACDATPLPEIETVLRVELLGRFAPPPATPDAYRASIDCAADAVTIAVVAGDGRTKSTQTRLAAVPANVRARVVALAVAELVRDLDREPAAPPPPAPPPPSVPVARLEPPPPPREPLVVALGAFGAASRFPASRVSLFGGGLRFDAVYGPLAVGLDATLEEASQSFPQGTARALVAYGSPYAAWHLRWGPAWTRLGVGWALGVARLDGQADEPGAFAGSTAGAWTAPYGLFALGVHLFDRVGVEARGELGWVTSPVVGEVTGSRGLALEHGWGKVEVGITMGL